MANMAITKRAIHSAFMELLNERTLNKITVKDITDRCGINRNTFYYHYQDIPALVEEICAGEVERVVREYPSVHSLEECLTTLCSYAMKNRRAILHIYYSDNRLTYVNSLWRMCEHTATAFIDTLFAGRGLSERDKTLLIRYYKYECYGLIVDWISSGMKEDMLEDIHRICYLKQEAPEEVLRRSSANRARL